MGVPDLNNIDQAELEQEFAEAGYYNVEVDQSLSKGSLPRHWEAFDQLHRHTTILSSSVSKEHKTRLSELVRVRQLEQVSLSQLG